MSIRKITGTGAHLVKIKIAEYYIQLEKDAGGVINLDWRCRGLLLLLRE